MSEWLAAELRSLKTRLQMSLAAELTGGASVVLLRYLHRLYFSCLSYSVKPLHLI